MDIGTAKPSKEEIKEIDYHFIDEYNVNEEVSLFIFQKKMRKVIDKKIIKKIKKCQQKNVNYDGSMDDFDE